MVRTHTEKAEVQGDVWMVLRGEVVAYCLILKWHTHGHTASVGRVKVSQLGVPVHNKGDLELGGLFYCIIQTILYWAPLKSDAGTACHQWSGSLLLLSRECSSHVTTYFRTFVRTFERMLCRGANIRVNAIGRYPDQNKLATNPKIQSGNSI